MKKYFENKELLNSRNIRFGVDNTLITSGAAAFAVMQMHDRVKKASERTDVTIVSDFQILSKEVRSTSYYKTNMASSSPFPRHVSQASQAA